MSRSRIRSGVASCASSAPPKYARSRHVHARPAAAGPPSWRSARRGEAGWAAAHTVGQTCVSSVHAAGASETSDFVRGDSSLLCRPEIEAGAATAETEEVRRSCALSQ